MDSSLIVNTFCSTQSTIAIEPTIISPGLDIDLSLTHHDISFSDLPKNKEINFHWQETGKPFHNACGATSTIIIREQCWR